MKPIVIAEHIRAPRQAVFAAFSDFAAVPGRARGIKAVELLTSGPTREGTRFRETREFHGRPASEVMTVTEWRPGESYALVCTSHGMAFRTHFEFRDGADGCDTVVTFDAKPTSMFTWAMAPLMGMMLGAVRQCITDDITDLKRYVETGHESSDN